MSAQRPGVFDDSDTVPLFDVDPETVRSSPPSLQPVLLAAATLWCRTMTWPSVKDIAEAAGVSGSTSVWATGSTDQIRTALIEAERRTIAGQGNALVAVGRSGVDAFTDAFRARARTLAACDPALARLPLLAAMVLGDGMMTAAAMGALLGVIAEDDPTLLAVL